MTNWLWSILVSVLFRYQLSYLDTSLMYELEKCFMEPLLSGGSWHTASLDDTQAQCIIQPHLLLSGRDEFNSYEQALPDIYWSAIIAIKLRPSSNASLQNSLESQLMQLREGDSSLTSHVSEPSADINMRSVCSVCERLAWRRFISSVGFTTLNQWTSLTELQIYKHLHLKWAFPLWHHIVLGCPRSGLLSEPLAIMWWVQEEQLADKHLQKWAVFPAYFVFEETQFSPVTICFFTTRWKQIPHSITGQHDNINSHIYFNDLRTISSLLLFAVSCDSRNLRQH